MIKRLVLLLLLAYSAKAQKVVSNTDLKLQSGGSGFFFGIGSGDAEIIPFASKNLNKTILCVRDKEKAYLLELQSTLEIKLGATFNTIPYSELLGGFLEEEKLTLVYTTNRNKEINIQKIFLKDGTSKNFSFSLDKKEKFITFFSENNQCYLITSLKNTSKVRVYQFDDPDPKSHQEFELESIQVNGSQWPFYYVFEKDPVFISNDSPTSFSKSSSTFKIYAQNNKVFMTLDNVINYTKIIELNLEVGSSKVSKFETSVGNCEYASNNSLIYDNNVYQLIICDSYLNLSIRSLDTGLNLNSFTALEDEDIHFRNGPIVQEGGGTVYSADRNLELKNTKRFLSKASRMSPALTIEEINNKLILDIGATKEITQASGGGGFYGAGGSMSTPYGSVPMPTYNYTGSSYSSNTWSKSTYFKTLLNVNSYEHIEGDLPKSIYDRVEQYESSIDQTIRIKNLFRLSDKYYFCFYDKKEDQMILVEFD